MNKKEKGTIIKRSIIGSIILFILFIILQLCESPILDLDSKWIVVSIIPLLFSLIYTGVIKNFKGFGIELETSLTDTVANFDIAGDVETIDSPQLQKGSQDHIFNIEVGRRRKIERLKFTLKRRRYYDREVIEQYFLLLPNLRFIELTEKNGKFTYLIRASLFRRGRNNEFDLDNEKIDLLIRAIETDSVLRFFPDTVDKFISTNSSLIEAYKMMESTNQGRNFNDQILPLVNDDGVMIGLVNRRKIEESISKQVLDLIEKS